MTGSDVTFRGFKKLFGTASSVRRLSQKTLIFQRKSLFQTCKHEISFWKHPATIGAF
jgi:hypothetical protein